MALSPYQHFQARFLNRLKEEVAAEEYSPVHAERLQFSLAVFEFELLSHTLNFTVPDVIYAEMLIHKMDRAGYEDSIFRSAVDQVILAVHFSIFGVTEEEKAREAILRGDKLIFTGDGTGDIQFKRADYEEQNEGDPSIDDESEGEQQQQQDQTFSAPIAIMNGNNPFPNLVILPPHMSTILSQSSTPLLTFLL